MLLLNYWAEWQPDLAHVLMFVALAIGGFNTGYRLAGPRRPRVTAGPPSPGSEGRAPQPTTALGMTGMFLDSMSRRTGQVRQTERIAARAVQLRAQGILTSAEAQELYAAEHTLRIMKAATGAEDAAAG